MRNNPPKGDLSPVRKWITPVLFGTAIGLLGTACNFNDFCFDFDVAGYSAGDDSAVSCWSNGNRYFFRRVCFCPNRGKKRPVVRLFDRAFVLFHFDWHFSGRDAFFSGCVSGGEDGGRFHCSLHRRCFGRKRKGQKKSLMPKSTGKVNQ